MTSKKGATEFDKKCHSIFDAKNDGRDYLARGVNLPCDNCGHELRAYYCESKLYLVECEFCGIKALVKERSPQAAAHTAFGRKTALWVKEALAMWLERYGDARVVSVTEDRPEQMRMEGYE